MKQKSIKNTIRNIALVVLTLLMAGLSLFSVVSAVGSDTLLKSFQRSLGHANLGYEVRSGDSPAAYPSSVAMTGTDGVLYGAAYNERSTAQLYESTRDLMGNALSMAEQFEPFTEEELCGLLAGDTLCYAYNGEIPASALAAWLEGRCGVSMNISMLLLTREGRMVLRTREEGLLSADTTVDRNAWQRAASALSANPCSYAGTASEPVYSQLAAETLLFDGAPPSADVLLSGPPAFGDPNGASSLQTLLGAFDYSVYARSYQERDAQVYVDNDSTIRINADGTVHYSAARRENEQTEPLPVPESIEKARAILERAQYSIGAGTQTELLSCTEADGGRMVLQFGLVFEGIPVVTGDPYARFDFADFKVIRSVIRLRRFTATGERQYVLPAAQAAAAAQRPGQRLGIAYVESGPNLFAAERCFTFVRP